MINRFLKETIQRNRSFLFSLDKRVLITFLILLLLHFSFSLYYLLTTPLHYDEWHSFKFFSGRSFWTIISDYPAPNNHIFYNLVARLILLTGAEGEIGVRIPALLASAFTIFYFFKLCIQLFNQRLSLFLLCYVMIQFPFLDYSFLARGYGFLNLFCVLTLYSSLKLSANYLDKRYRILFILSQFLGLYTVPSFLYALPFVYVVLIVYVFKQKGSRPFRLFITDGLICLLLVSFFYAFIFFNNDPQNFLNPNGGSNNFSVDDSDFREKFVLYLNSIFFELFGIKRIFYPAFFVLVVSIYKVAKERQKSQYAIILCTLMFFSPLIITLIHHVHLFSRNWLFIIFPMTLCFGFVIQTGLSFFKSASFLNFFKKYFSFVCLVIVALVFTQHTLFGNKRRIECNWDYKLDFLRKKKLKPLTQKIKTIGMTRVNLEYYAADEIMYFCQRKYHTRWIHLTPLSDTTHQDILVVYKTEQEKYRRKFLNYNFFYYYDDYWIYLKKDTIKKPYLVQP